MDIAADLMAKIGAGDVQKKKMFWWYYTCLSIISRSEKSMTYV